MMDMAGSILLILILAVLLSLFLASRLSRAIVQPLNGLDLEHPLSNTIYIELKPLLYRLDLQKNQLLERAQELEQRQKEFSTVTHSLSEGLILLSSSGTILSINPAAARLLGVTPNCAGADFSAANTYQPLSGGVEQALKGCKTECSLALPGGDYLAVANPVPLEGNVFGVVILIMDVTQQKKAEALRRSFTANVSHELKTPLHAISGYAEIMQTGLARPEDMPRFSEKIYTEAQRLIRLVEDILRLSRLEEGAGDMQWDNVDLHAAARETLQTLSGAAELAQVALTLSGDAPVISAIPNLVSAILFNLTDNAVKYNRPGGTVSLDIREDGDQVILTVRDTGIGIPQEDRERIFERFYRVDKSRSKEVGGTGLGLSIVKHAALHLGARIQVESIPGTGTTVTVYFPLKQREKETIVHFT